MMNKYTVYKHTFPNGKIYIGITRRKPSIRWKNGKGYHSNIYMQNAINKYGWNNVKHEILNIGLTLKEACDLEKKYIKDYKSYIREFGYNIDLGGTQEKILSDETIKKLSVVAKKQKYKRSRKIYQYDLNGNFIKTWFCIADAVRFLHLKEKAQNEIINCCKGKSPKGLRLTAYNYIWLYDNNIEERLKQISSIKTSKFNKHIIPIIQYTLDGKLVHKFNNASDAAKYISNKLNKDFINVHRNICATCYGKQKSAFGYVWLKESDDIQKRLEEIKDSKWNKMVGVRSKPIQQYSLDGTFIEEYNSLTDACKALKLDMNCRSTISQCGNGIKKSAYGYKWKYITE